MLIAGFNLARSDYRGSRRQVILAVAVVAGLLLVLAGQVVGWAALRNRGQVVGARLAQMEEVFRRHQEEIRTARAAAPDEARKRYEAKVAAFNQILEASAFSWTGLLVELERSVPPGVTLSEIQPDLATGQVMLRGTARSFDDLGRLLHGLEQRTTFRDVFLMRQAVRKSATGGPEVVELSVSLIYQGREQ